MARPGRSGGAGDERRHRPLLGLTTLSREPRRLPGALGSPPHTSHGGILGRELPNTVGMCVGVSFVQVPPRLDPSQTRAPRFTQPSPRPGGGPQGGGEWDPRRWRCAPPGPSQAAPSNPQAPSLWSRVPTPATRAHTDTLTHTHPGAQTPPAAPPRPLRELSLIHI